MSCTSKSVFVLCVSRLVCISNKVLYVMLNIPTVLWVSNVQFVKFTMQSTSISHVCDQSELHNVYFTMCLCLFHPRYYHILLYISVLCMFPNTISLHLQFQTMWMMDAWVIYCVKSTSFEIYSASQSICVNFDCVYIPFDELYITFVASPTWNSNGY